MVKKKKQILAKRIPGDTEICRTTEQNKYEIRNRFTTYEIQLKNNLSERWVSDN